MRQKKKQEAQIRVFHDQETGKGPKRNPSYKRKSGKFAEGIGEKVGP